MAHHTAVDESTLRSLLAPRDDTIVREERVAPTGEAGQGGTDGEAGQDGTDGEAGQDGTAEFRAAEGPFTSYRRTVAWEHTGPDRWDVTTGVQFRLAIPVFWPMFAPLVHRALQRPLRPDERLWWSTPDRLTPRQSTVIAVMCIFHVVGGMLYAFLTNLLTFASADIGDGSAGQQSLVLVVARVGAVITIVVMAGADRLGRRRIAVWSAALAVALTLASALAPTLVVLAGLQTVSRNLAITAMLAADTLSVEEIPAGTRAAASGLGALSYGLGAGVVVLALPLADLGPGGWRVVFAASVICVPLIVVGARRLPESGRFLDLGTAPATQRSTEERRADRRTTVTRFAVLGGLFFLINMFVAPSSQLQNDYLRADRGFSGARITLFIVLTGVPGFIGILVGGRMADRRGRRGVMLVGLLSTAVMGAGFFVLSGAPMWVVATVGAVLGTLAVPALGVIAPELFPTARRGAARGALSAVGTSGSVAGLLAAGFLVDRLGYGTAFTYLALAPLAAAALSLLVPETAGRELEELNEERRRAPSDPTSP